MTEGLPVRFLRRHTVWLARCVVWAFCLSVALWVGPAAQAAPPTGDDLRRLLGEMVKCLEYAEWPDRAAPKAGEPFVVALFGGNPFGESIFGMTNRTIANQVIGEHTVKVVKYEKLEDVKPCHLLFINSTEMKNVPKLIEQLKSSSVLTVSDSDGFTRIGGMIKLILHDNKFLYEISKSALDRAGVGFQKELLSCAKAVK